MKGKKFLLIPCNPNLHNSNSCPSIFKTNKNNSISIINNKVEETKYGKNMSFIELAKNNKIFILTLIDKDKLQISEASSQSYFDSYIQENRGPNELAFELNSLINKGVFDNNCSDQENKSNPKYSKIIYMSKNNDLNNNQLSYNKNKYEEYIKELEKKIEILKKEKQDILNRNKELTKKVEDLKKYIDNLEKLQKTINTSNYLSNEEELKNENQLLKEAKLLENNKKELNDDLQNNENLIKENEIKEQNNYEKEKLIKVMRKEFDLKNNDYNDEKLSEVLDKADNDKEYAFSLLFND